VYRLASPPRLSVPSDSFRLRAQRGHISTGSRAAPNQRWGGMGGASPQSVIDATAADLTRRLELRRLEALSAATRHFSAGSVSGQTRSRCPAERSSRGCPPACGCGSLSGCGPSGTVTRRGSRGDCPARSSNAHLAVLSGRRERRTLWRR